MSTAASAAMVVAILQKKVFFSEIADHLNVSFSEYRKLFNRSTISNRGTS